MLPFCDQVYIAGNPQPLDAEAIHQQAIGMAEEGFRVLAFAMREIVLDAVAPSLDESVLSGMTLQALAGFIDPLRPEMRAAVETARMAGIQVVMITGDHPATALAIGQGLGIAETYDQVVTGQELAEIGDFHVPEFFERVKHANIFARVTPDQKLHIVGALMCLRHFVAVTGDGVNDAPALRKANIGVAMGSGTDVAKDTALLIVTDIILPQLLLESKKAVTRTSMFEK